jgi:hypothetical protein
MRLHSKPILLDSVELPGVRGIETVMQAVPQPSPQRAASSLPKDDPAFDRWLQQELGRLHNDVLREPIPDRLLDIIESAVNRN